MIDRDDDGYTLIEILVALVLLGLMATMTVNVFQRLGAVRSIQSRYEARSNIASVVNYIGSEIGRAMAIPLSTDADGMMRSLEGTATLVRFVAATRSGFKEDALREISFYLENTHGEIKILRRIRSRTVSEFSPDNRTDELLRGATGFRLSYRSGHEGDPWIESWQNKAKLPEAIRIQVADSVSGVVISRTVPLVAGARSNHSAEAD